jgi:hypothetical protein
MFAQLDASGYKYSSTFYNAEFEGIFSKIIICYNMMVVNNVRLESDENKIRDLILKDYLNDNSVRQQVKLTDFLFNREVPEDNDLGRTDIKIETQNTFVDTKAYYIIECKRLDSQNQTGTTGLNGKYISDGICRFVSGKYSTYKNTNGMIGFVVQSMDINDNTNCINGLLANKNFQVNTTLNLQYRKIVDNFEHSYFSTHSIGQREIIIYHLMLDFSKNIQ